MKHGCGILKSPLCVLYLENNDDGRSRKIERKRQDDNELDFITRKLRFESEILPILEYLKDQNLIFQINAGNPLKEVIECAYKIIRESFMKACITFCDTSRLNVQKHSEFAQLPK